jgi:alpha-galactosidase
VVVDFAVDRQRQSAVGRTQRLRSAGRIDDRRALGDWEVDPVRWPEGLDPLIDRVRSLGMEFGLWVEPEMINDDSDLARARPEWIRGPAGAGRVPRTGRNQRVLDLSRPEVVEHLYAVLDRLLCRYDIGYLKWDHNRTLTGQAAAGGPGHLRQTLAVHALLDRLRARHPRVEIETCASGGGRADWGMLARTHRVWTSDCNDPVTRARIMAGVGPHLPPEVAGVHLGPEEAWLTGRITGLDFRAAVGLLGAFGLELDPTTLATEEHDRLKALVARYRRWRAVLHGGLQATPVDDEDHLVRVVTAADREQALVVVLRLDDRVPGHGIRFPLADLDPSARYRLRLSPPLPDPELRPVGLAAMRPWIDGVEADGAWLASVGLTLQLPAPQRAVVLEVERVSSC